MEGAGLRILCCWGYTRRGWVAPIERLADERGHELTYLSYRTSDEEPEVVAIPPDRSRVYWRDFPSPGAMLRSLRPDTVLVMGADGAWALGLLAAARSAGVPTVLLQHGIDVPQVSLAPERRVPARGTIDPSGSAALRYLWSATWRNPARALWAALDAFEARRGRRTRWVRRHGLRPDRHLVAGDRGAQRILERDPGAAGSILAIGLPELDPLFREVGPPAGTRRLLLIDTPHTGGPHSPAVISPARKAAVLSELAAGLGRAGWTLQVKLHPASYGDDWPDTVQGAEVVREADPVALVTSCDAVVGFDSTLLVGALHLRPGAVVGAELAPSWFVDAARDGGLPIIEGYDSLTAPAVLEVLGRDDPGLRRRVVGTVLAGVDGRALDRVEAELVNVSASAWRAGLNLKKSKRLRRSSRA